MVSGHASTKLPPRLQECSTKRSSSQLEICFCSRKPFHDAAINPRGSHIAWENMHGPTFALEPATQTRPVRREPAAQVSCGLQVGRTSRLWVAGRTHKSGVGRKPTAQVRFGPRAGRTSQVWVGAPPHKSGVRRKPAAQVGCAPTPTPTPPGRARPRPSADPTRPPRRRRRPPRARPAPQA